MSVIILIPAYNPSDKIAELSSQLSSANIISNIIIVNDGCAVEYNSIFDQVKKIPKTIVLTHPVNKGKGAALKSGLNYVYFSYSNYAGIITADADMQHSVSDILKVADALSANPSSLILGVRSFDNNVPFRSKFGNTLTKQVMNTFFGLNISDTQTGLRGIPLNFISALINIPFNRYEFEMEMLLIAQEINLHIKEVPIQTIYIEGNASSHFNPLIDSMKIYFILFRYMFASVVSAIIDYMVFIWTFRSIQNILFVTYFSRFFALFIHYYIGRNIVFRSEERIMRTFPRYMTLILLSGFASSAMIYYFVESLGLEIVKSKLLAEAFLYFSNFAIQKEFVFTKKRPE